MAGRRQSSWAKLFPQGPVDGRGPVTTPPVIHAQRPIFAPLSKLFAAVITDGVVPDVEKIGTAVLVSLSCNPLNAAETPITTHCPAPTAYPCPAGIALGPFPIAIGVDRKSTRLNSSHVKISYA